MLHPSSRTSGFTLIEMSIVITIVALIIGGVITGKNLLKGAERRSVITDVERYIAAVQSYQTKYSNLPGDNYEATTVWGAAHATPATCITTNSGGVATCNGDGNGQIGNSSSEYEMWRAWQQLNSAGYIESRFTGVAGSGGVSHAVINSNAPESKMKGIGFTLRYLGTGSGNYFTGISYGHILEFGGNSAASYTNNPALLAEDAYAIDVKADDGLPASGNIHTYTNTARTNCASTDVITTAVYSVTNTNVGCNLVFLTGF